jgi:hypothetical protein
MISSGSDGSGNNDQVVQGLTLAEFPSNPFGNSKSPVPLLTLQLSQYSRTSGSSSGLNAMKSEAMFDVEITMANIVPVSYGTTPAQVLDPYLCEASRFPYTVSVRCADGDNMTAVCPGSRGLLNLTCPAKHWAPSCTLMNTSGNFVPASTQCQVLSYTELKTVCLCSNLSFYPLQSYQNSSFTFGRRLASASSGTVFAFHSFSSTTELRITSFEPKWISAPIIVTSDYSPILTMCGLFGALVLTLGRLFWKERRLQQSSLLKEKYIKKLSEERHHKHSVVPLVSPLGSPRHQQPDDNSVFTFDSKFSRLPSPSVGGKSLDNSFFVSNTEYGRGVSFKERTISGFFDGLVSFVEPKCTSFVQKLSKSHCWVAAFSRHSNRDSKVGQDRMEAITKLFVRVLACICSSTVVVGIWHPDNRSCEHIRTKSACVSAHNLLVQDRSQCVWQEQFRYCYYNTDAVRALEFAVMLCICVVINIVVTDISFHFLGSMRGTLRLLHVASRDAEIDKVCVGVKLSSGVIGAEKGSVSSGAPHSSGQSVGGGSALSLPVGSLAGSVAPDGHTLDHMERSAGFDGFEDHMTSSKAVLILDEFISSAQASKNYLWLLAARLRKQNQQIDLCLPGPETDALMQLTQKERRHQHDQNAVIVFAVDGQLTLGKLLYGNYINHSVRALANVVHARQSAHGLHAVCSLALANAQKAGSDAAQCRQLIEQLLVANFFIECFDGYEKIVAQRLFHDKLQLLQKQYQPYWRHRQWAKLVMSAFGLVTLIAAMALFTVYFDWELGTRATYLWMCLLLVSTAIDTAIVHPLCLLVPYFCFSRGVIDKIWHLNDELKMRGRLILMRSTGLIRNASGLVQHFNAACRVARLFPAFPVCRFLICVNDLDLLTVQMDAHSGSKHPYETLRFVFNSIVLRAIQWLPGWTQDLIINLVVCAPLSAIPAACIYLVREAPWMLPMVLVVLSVSLVVGTVVFCISPYYNLLPTALVRGRADSGHVNDSGSILAASLATDERDSNSIINAESDVLSRSLASHSRSSRVTPKPGASQHSSIASSRRQRTRGRSGGSVAVAPNDNFSGRTSPVVENYMFESEDDVGSFASMTTGFTLDKSDVYKDLQGKKNTYAKRLPAIRSEIGQTVRVAKQISVRYVDDDMHHGVGSVMNSARDLDDASVFSAAASQVSGPPIFGRSRSSSMGPGPTGSYSNEFDGADDFVGWKSRTNRPKDHQAHPLVQGSEVGSVASNFSVATRISRQQRRQRPFLLNADGSIAESLAEDSISLEGSVVTTTVSPNRRRVVSVGDSSIMEGGADWDLASLGSIATMGTLGTIGAVQRSPKHSGPGTGTYSADPYSGSSDYPDMESEEKADRVYKSHRKRRQFLREMPVNHNDSSIVDLQGGNK